VNVTTVKYEKLTLKEINAKGLSIKLKATIKGSHYKRFNWIQKTSENGSEPRLDTDPGQKTPYYNNPATGEESKYSTHKDGSGTTEFSDNPHRQPGQSTVTWHADLTLVGIDKSGANHPLEHISYGFSLQPRGDVELEPLRIGP